MWYLQDLMDASIRQIVFRAIIIFIIGFLVGFFVGCDTPYSGTLGPDDFDGWITEQGDDFVCLENGFDALCIKTILGPRGEPGRDGNDGRDGVDGRDGIDGMPGKDGSDGRDGAVLTLTRETVIERNLIFVVFVSMTDTTYLTPVGSVHVAASGAVEHAPDVEVEVVDTPPSVPVSNPNPPHVPTHNPPSSDNDRTIWHVIETPEGFKMYRRPATLEGLEDLLETFDRKWFGHTEYQGDAEFIHEQTGLTGLVHLKEVAE